MTIRNELIGYKPQTLDLRRDDYDLGGDCIRERRLTTIADDSLMQLCRMGKLGGRGEGRAVNAFIEANYPNYRDIPFSWRPDGLLEFPIMLISTLPDSSNDLIHPGKCVCDDTSNGDSGFIRLFFFDDNSEFIMNPSCWQSVVSYFGGSPLHGGSSDLERAIANFTRHNPNPFPPYQKRSGPLTYNPKPESLRNKARQTTVYEVSGQKSIRGSDRPCLLHVDSATK